jgi:hypothetical protein
MGADNRNTDSKLIYRGGERMTEQEKAYAEKLKSLDFLNFLFNAINPNEMEQYISMYLCSGEKSLSNENAGMDA